MCAAAECGASPAFVERYVAWLAMLVSAYAPFVDAKTGSSTGWRRRPAENSRLVRNRNRLEHARALV